MEPAKAPAPEAAAMKAPAAMETAAAMAAPATRAHRRRGVERKGHRSREKRGGGPSKKFRAHGVPSFQLAADLGAAALAKPEIMAAFQF
jgi:hypothetical protein